MKGKHKEVICFGEVLWDNLPSGKKPGGAPMNVAYHLKKLGVASNIISKVGKDKNGEALLNALKSLALAIEYCQIDQEAQTSTVEVRITPDNEVKYDIVFPVSWDYITYENRFEKLVQNSGAFVFGSLVGRNGVSRSTLDKLLNFATYKVFDANLREPFYEEDYISHLLGKTDLLKLNVSELDLITNWYSDACKNELNRVQLLLDKFNIKEIIVTKGSRGASYYTPDSQYHCPAFKIKVKDTVGSGDSFLAAFLSKRLTNDNAGDALSFASAVGAYITTLTGACPTYTKSDISRFILESKINEK